jgi:hypothetical protein
MRHTDTIVVILCALALVVGAQCYAAEGLRIETGALTALNSTADLGVAVSVGAELPTWVPLAGGHLGFVDLLTARGTEAIGLSVSIRTAEADDGWRIGATVTQPDEGAREVLGYLRYGVSIQF